MTVPFRVGEQDPLDILKGMKGRTQNIASGADPLEELKASKPRPQHGAMAPMPIQNESTNALPRNRENPSGDFQAATRNLGKQAAFVGKGVAANVLNAAQGIPGMEAFEAAAGSLGSKLTDNPLSYRESRDALRGETDKIWAPIRIAERVAGGIPLAAALPGNPAASGAIVGGADQALSADPDMSGTERAGRTVAGAAGGAALGKLVIDPMTTLARTLTAKNAAQHLRLLDAARSARSAPLYDKAMGEGLVNNMSTPEVKQFLASPDVAEIVQGLQQTRQFAGKSPESPEMLDAIYKTFSDQAGQVRRGLDAVTPTRPNIGRFRGQDIRAAQDQGLDAMSGTAGAPGPMPSYRPAVENFAQGSRNIDAAQKGADFVKHKLAGGLPTAKNIVRTSPEEFSAWGEGATVPVEERRAAQGGILGAVKSDLARSPLTTGRKALFAAPGLLRSAPTPEQQWIEAMQNLGILSAGNATTP